MEYIITLKKKLKKKFFLDFNFPLKKSIKKMEMMTYRDVIFTTTPPHVVLMTLKV